MEHVGPGAVGGKAIQRGRNEGYASSFVIAQHLSTIYPYQSTSSNVQRDASTLITKVNLILAPVAILLLPRRI